MDGKKLAIDINRRISEAGYKQEVYAIGPSGIPIPAKALLPAGFQLIINLVPIPQGDTKRSDQPKNLSHIPDKQSSGNGVDAISDKSISNQPG